MSDAPTWYDLLDVPRDASADDVRAAWKTQIADLEPGDRRFDALNRAAKVLLDPDARAAYDAALAPEGPEDSPAVHRPGGRGGRPGARHETRRAPVATEASTGAARRAVVAPRGPRRGGGRAAGGHRRGCGPPATTAPATRRRATPRWRPSVPSCRCCPTTTSTSRPTGRPRPALMTGQLQVEDYDKLFAVLEDNAPQTQTKVTASVIASGIVRASDDRVQVLVFVDRPTTNKLSAEPVVYKDQVTLSMQRVDDEWLVDDLVTSPVQG